MARTSRRILVGIVVVVGLATGLGWFALRRADRFVTDFQARPERSRDYAVAFAPAQHWAAPRPAGLGAATAVDESRDGAVLEGDLFVATSGGVLVEPASAATGAAAAAAWRGPLLQLDGLVGAAPSAIIRFGERTLIGDENGGLTLLDRSSAVALRIATPRRGAIVALAATATTAYLLHSGVGLIAFDGQRAVAAAGEVDLHAGSALCVGASGVVVGTRDGDVWAVRGPAATEVVRLAHFADEPVTALSCDGALLAGTPFGLRRLGEQGSEELARDHHVTSLLATPEALYVATFDDGVLVLDPRHGAPRAHHLAGRRLLRLRLLDEKVVAFGPGGPFVLGRGEFAALTPPARGLSGAHVTALARDAGGRLWVGTFESGIDVLDAQLRPLRHLAAGPTGDARDEQVNALLSRPTSGEMVVASVGGATLLAGEVRHPLPLGDPSASADPIAALAATGPGLAFGGARGVHLVDGARVRTIYAFHGLANNHVYALAAVGDTLYAGTLAGLSVLGVNDGKVGRTIGVGPRALRVGWVTALTAAPEGVYAGTYGGGVQLVRAPPDRAVEDLSPLLGRLHVNPGALAIDGDRLWIGTLEAGLYAWDRLGHALRRLPASAHLLPCDNVTALLADGDALLVGTTAGVYRLDRAGLEAALVPATSPPVEAASPEESS